MTYPPESPSPWPRACYMHCGRPDYTGSLYDGCQLTLGRKRESGVKSVRACVRHRGVHFFLTTRLKRNKRRLTRYTLAKTRFDYTRIIPEHHRPRYCSSIGHVLSGKGHRQVPRRLPFACQVDACANNSPVVDPGGGSKGVTEPPFLQSRLAN